MFVLSSVGAKQRENASRIRIVQSLVQPAAHEAELPVNRCFRGVQQLGSLFGGKPKKEPQFNHAAFPWIQLVQLHQDPVQVHPLHVTSVDPSQILFKRHSDSALAFLPILRACMIDQNAPHQSRRKTVEVRAIFKPQAALAYQLQEQFVHHAGRLQDIFRTLAAEECP